MQKKLILSALFLTILTALSGCGSLTYCGDGMCNGEETPENCSDDCKILKNECTNAGYKCTSAIRGCGHYEEFNLNCGATTVVCCQEIPYCGDGVCMNHNLPDYKETIENCAQDCNNSNIFCGDSLCDSLWGEDINTCPQDCRTI